MHQLKRERSPIITINLANSIIPNWLVACFNKAEARAIELETQYNPELFFFLLHVNASNPRVLSLCLSL